MSDNPAWLESGNVGPTPPPAEVFSLDSTSATVTTSSGSPAAVQYNAEDEKDLPGIILVMRLANMIASIALITISVLTMLSLPSIATWVLAIYATCGGILICCLETQLKFLRVLIAVNFGFLFNAGMRFLFYILLASVAWSYSVFGQILAAGLALTAVFNTFVLFRYPSYRKMRERIAEEEDKRIEARISKEVKKQAINSIRS